MTDADRRTGLHALWHNPLNEPIRRGIIFCWHMSREITVGQREWRTALNLDQGRRAEMQRFRDDLSL